MNEKILFVIIAILCAVSFGAGFFIATSISDGDKIRIIKLENTVTRITDALADATSRADALSIQLDNSRAELGAIRARIRIAENIANEINSGIGQAVDAVDRIIRKVELLESALSVVLNW